MAHTQSILSIAISSVLNGGNCICRFRLSVLGRRFRISSAPFVGFPSTTNGNRRHLVTKPAELRTDNIKNAKFKVIYRFSHIRLMRLIARMKLFQTGITVVAIPPAVYLYSAGHIDAIAIATTLSVAAFASFMLIIMSQLVQKVLGLVAVSDNVGFVRLSHLTFWGKRHDVFVPFNDIVPLSDLDENTKDAFVKLRRYSSRDVFYLSLRFGLIEDRAKMQRLLGTISG